MFGFNGTQLKQWLQKMLADWSNAAKAWRTKQGPLLPRERLLYALMLAALVLSLVACGTTSAPSDFTPRNPLPPQTTLSESSETFSSLAQKNISAWRSKLMQLTAK